MTQIAENQTYKIKKKKFPRSLDIFSCCNLIQQKTEELQNVILP